MTMTTKKGEKPKQRFTKKQLMAQTLNAWAGWVGEVATREWEHEVGLSQRGGDHVSWQNAYRTALLEEEELRRKLIEVYGIPFLHPKEEPVIRGFNHESEPSADSLNYYDRNDEALHPGEKPSSPRTIIRKLAKQYDFPAAPVLRLVPKGDWDAEEAMKALAKALNEQGLDTYYSDSRFEVFMPVEECDCQNEHKDWTAHTVANQ